MKRFQNIIIVCGLLLGAWFAVADDSRIASIPPEGEAFWGVFLSGVIGIDMRRLGRLIEDRFGMIAEVKDMSGIKPPGEMLQYKTPKVTGYISFSVVTTNGILYENVQCKIYVITKIQVTLKDCGNDDVRLSARKIHFPTKFHPYLIVTEENIEHIDTDTIR